MVIYCIFILDIDKQYINDDFYLIVDKVYVYKQMFRSV